MGKIIEENGERYIVEYRGNGTVICKTLYAPTTEISGNTLWNRFSEEEQENLIDSANKKIKRFLYELRIRPRFCLTDPKLINAVNALESAGIIDEGRAAVILST